MFEFTQRVARRRTVSARIGRGCDAPFHKGFVRARKLLLVVVGSSGADAGESPPSIGEILSNVGPPPRHSPSTRRVVVGETQFFQRCFHMKRLKGSALRPSSLCVAADRICAAIPIASSITSGVMSSADGSGSSSRRTKSQHTKIKKAVPKFFARFSHREDRPEKYSAAARGGNQRFFGLQIAAVDPGNSPYFPGVLNQTLLLDDAQIMGRAHHIGEVSAQVEFKRLGNRKAYLSRIIDAAARPSQRRPALFFPNASDRARHRNVRAPVAAGGAHAALHLVKNQAGYRFSVGIFRSFCSHSPAKMVVAPSP